MKLLPLLLTFFIPLPSQAMTWNDLMNSYQNRTPYVQPQRIYDRSGFVALCNLRVLREEYIPASGSTPGYVKRWEEFVKVPCNELHNNRVPCNILNNNQMQYY